MTKTENKKIFNQAIKNTDDADTIAKIEIVREYVTNPEFRTKLQQIIWDTNNN